MSSLGEYLSRFDYAAIPLHRGPTGHLQLVGSLNGVRVSLLLDTGAGHTVLDLAQARNRELPLPEIIQPAGGLGTANMGAYRTVVRQFALPAIEENDFVLAVVDLSHINETLRAHGAAPMDGVVGADILERREAVIDDKHLQLYLKRTGNSRAARTRESPDHR